MRLSLDTPDNLNVIRSYDSGWINVNGEQIMQSLLVLPQQLVTDWPPQRFEELAEAHFARIAALQPELVLLGTGARQQFPHPRLTRPLREAGIGVEVMDTRAACRTYNIILMEGREVLAALLMI